MSDNKHTPAPWFVGANTNNDGSVSIVSDEWRVCVVDAVDEFPRGQGWKHQDASRDANARLIAAAPDLLEALVLLEREMVLSGNADSEDYGWKPAIKKTRAAIAKAEGR